MESIEQLPTVYIIADDPQFIEAKKRETELRANRGELEQRMADATQEIVDAKKRREADSDAASRIEAAVVAGASTLDTEKINVAALAEKRRAIKAELEAAAEELAIQTQVVQAVRRHLGKRVLESARPRLEKAKESIVAAVRQLHEAAKEQMAVLDAIEAERVSVGDIERMGGANMPHTRNLYGWASRKGEVAQWLAKHDTEASEG